MKKNQKATKLQFLFFGFYIANQSHHNVEALNSVWLLLVSLQSGNLKWVKYEMVSLQPCFVLWKKINIKWGY